MGLLAAEWKATRAFIGFVGLHTPSAELPFSPCIEVGGRLAFQHWDKGFATEAASKALSVGFQVLQLQETVSFTTPGNRRYRAVMERLGMRESGTFEHPHIPESTGLRQHFLYRLSGASHAAQPCAQPRSLRSPDAAR